MSTKLGFEDGRAMDKKLMEKIKTRGGQRCTFWQGKVQLFANTKVEIFGKERCKIAYDSRSGQLNHTDSGASVRRSMRKARKGTPERWTAVSVDFVKFGKSIHVSGNIRRVNLSGHWCSSEWGRTKAMQACGASLGQHALFHWWERSALSGKCHRFLATSQTMHGWLSVCLLAAQSLRAMFLLTVFSILLNHTVPCWKKTNGPLCHNSVQDKKRTTFFH